MWCQGLCGTSGAELRSIWCDGIWVLHTWQYWNGCHVLTFTLSSEGEVTEDQANHRMLKSSRPPAGSCNKKTVMIMRNIYICIWTSFCKKQISWTLTEYLCRVGVMSVHPLCVISFWPWMFCREFCQGCCFQDHHHPISPDECPALETETWNTLVLQLLNNSV